MPFLLVPLIRLGQAEASFGILLVVMIIHFYGRVIRPVTLVFVRIKRLERNIFKMEKA